ncbi:MAG: sulfite exporter TauE/SafE family protein [Bernardetiaceae bacterium]|nr:sulfite exporter TauE/SafE family protein [Bernardetiaceae bacterium]
MEYLNELATTSGVPLLSAFLLGLMTAISPCPLATNITATAYIARSFTHKRTVLWSGVLYTLGRALSYFSIAALIYFGFSKFQLAKLFQGNGEKFLGPLLIIIGLFMLGAIRIPMPKGLSWQDKLSDKFKDQGLVGSFLLGILFALAFCPYSGALFFGMLVPMVLQQPEGLSLALVFSLGTGLPVLLFTYLIAFSMQKVGRYFKAIQKTELVVRRVTALIFIAAGLYYVWIFFIS